MSLNSDVQFDQTAAPLNGGLNLDEMPTPQRMTFEGGAHSAPVSPDIFFEAFLLNATGPNGEPTTGDAGVSMVGYLCAIADVYISGVTNCVLRPWFWNPILAQWISGSEETIIRPRRLKTVVDGASGFYVEIVEFEVTDPANVKISIAVGGSA